MTPEIQSDDQKRPAPPSEVSRSDSEESKNQEGDKKNSTMKDENSKSDEEGGEVEEARPETADKPEAPHINPKEYLNMKSSYYYLVTLSCYFVVVLLSIVVGDVSIFFGFIGATAGTFAVFIAPGSFYVISVKKNNIPLTNGWEKAAYVMAWIYAIAGSIGLVGLNLCVVLNQIL